MPTRSVPPKWSAECEAADTCPTYAVRPGPSDDWVRTGLTSTRTFSLRMGGTRSRRIEGLTWGAEHLPETCAFWARKRGILSQGSRAAAATIPATITDRMPRGAASVRPVSLLGVVVVTTERPDRVAYGVEPEVMGVK